MVKSELIKRSPLRILEKSIHGGLGKGNIGIIASRKGIGKTACLVHIATDKLFQNKPVIHVSYSSRVDYIISWYEDIFKEISNLIPDDVYLESMDVRNKTITMTGIVVADDGEQNLSRFILIQCITGK